MERSEPYGIHFIHAGGEWLLYNFLLPDMRSTGSTWQQPEPFPTGGRGVLQILSEVNLLESDALDGTVKPGLDTMEALIPMQNSCV